MSQLQFQHQPIQTADDQYPRQHLHHVQSIAQYEPASFGLRQHLVPQCCAMCEARHVLQLRHLMLRCSAPYGRDLARCARARRFLPLLAVSHSLTLQWQDCVQLQSILRAFALHRPQGLPQRHLQ